jgi:hypothetical protein
MAENDDPETSITSTAQSGGITAHTVNIHGGSPQDEEGRRRKQLVAALAHEWLLSNDGVTSSELAGILSPRQTANINARLRELGEHWTVGETTGR